MKPIIVSDLVKIYNEQPVLNNVSISVEEGIITGLLGPNGSGKTTLIKIILGIIRRNRGNVLLYGKDPFRYPDTRNRVGYIPERPELPSSLSVRDVLIQAAKIYGVNTPKDNVDEAIAKSGLSGHEHKYFRELSAGLKQRAAIAHALVGEPELLIADEPTSNLDPLERLRILDLLVQFNREGKMTILFTGHVLAEVSRIANRLIVLMKGRVVFDGSPSDLVKTATTVSIRSSDPVKLASVLASYGYSVEAYPLKTIVILKDRKEIAKLFSELSRVSKEYSIEIFSLDTVEVALERLLERGG